jgi:hypothetical protein
MFRPVKEKLSPIPESPSDFLKYGRDEQRHSKNSLPSCCVCKSSINIDMSVKYRTTLLHNVWEVNSKICKVCTTLIEANLSPVVFHFINSEGEFKVLSLCREHSKKILNLTKTNNVRCVVCKETCMDKLNYVTLLIKGRPTNWINVRTCCSEKCRKMYVLTVGGIGPM